MTDHAHFCFLFFNHLLSANTRFLSPVLRQVKQDCPAGQRLSSPLPGALPLEAEVVMQGLAGLRRRPGSRCPGGQGQSSLPTAGCGWRQLGHTLSSPWAISSAPSAGLGPAPASAAACSLSYLGPSMEPRGRDAGWSWSRAPGRMRSALEGCEGRTRGSFPFVGLLLPSALGGPPWRGAGTRVEGREPCHCHTEPAFPRHWHSG